MLSNLYFNQTWNKLGHLAINGQSHDSVKQSHDCEWPFFLTIKEGKEGKGGGEGKGVRGRGGGTGLCHNVFSRCFAENDLFYV